jgi:hypothetical protein
VLGIVSASNFGGENGISDTAEPPWCLKHPASGLGVQSKQEKILQYFGTEVSNLLARRDDGRDDLELQSEQANRAEFETLA